MYTSFYELKQEPFHVTPDPEFLFPSPAHKEALAAIIYGIEQRKGFVAITGEVGVGKTTILRSYLDFADRQNLKLIYVYNSNLTFDELITTILQELGIRDRPASTFMAVTRLHEELIEVYRKNQTVVLIIDEAQNMPVETLESLRMLSNLETVTEKLIQIMLIGQPEFEELLQQHRLRQLKQRIAIHARISPLTPEDSVAYLEYRLAKVALGSKPVFTKNALRLITRVSQGIPRNLNILSDNALITGFGYQIRPVNTRVVKEVLVDRGLLPSADDPRRRRGAWIGAGAAAAAAAAAIAAFVLEPDLLDRAGRQAAQSTLPPAPDPQVRRPADRAVASAGNWVDQVRRPGSEPTPEAAPQGGSAPEPDPPAADRTAVEPKTKPVPEPKPESAPPPEPAMQASGPAAQAPLTPKPSSGASITRPEPAPAEPSSPASASASEPPAPAPSLTEPARPPAAATPAARDSAAPHQADGRPTAQTADLARGGATEPAPSVFEGARRAPPIPLAAPRRAPTSSPSQRPAPSIASAPQAAAEPSAYALAVPSVMMPSASGSGAAVATAPPLDPPPRVAPGVGGANGLIRTVRAGDSLWTMAEDVYGFVSPNVLRQVQDANPHLRNINVLSPGQEIVFPRVPGVPDNRGLTSAESPNGRN